MTAVPFLIGLLLVALSAAAGPLHGGEAPQSLGPIIEAIRSTLQQRDQAGLASGIEQLKAYETVHRGERALYRELLEVIAAMTVQLPDEPSYHRPWVDVVSCALDPRAAKAGSTPDDQAVVLRQQARIAEVVLAADPARYAKRIPAGDITAARVQQLTWACNLLAVVAQERIVDFQPPTVYLKGPSPAVMKQLEAMGVVYWPGTSAMTIQNLEARNLVLAWHAENERNRDLVNWQNTLQSVYDQLQPPVSVLAKPLVKAGGGTGAQVAALLAQAGLPPR